MFVSLSKSGKIFQAGSVGEVNTATCPCYAVMHHNSKASIDKSGGVIPGRRRQYLSWHRKELSLERGWLMKSALNKQGQNSLKQCALDLRESDMRRIWSFTAPVMYRFPRGSFVFWWNWGLWINSRSLLCSQVLFPFPMASSLPSLLRAHIYKVLHVSRWSC